MKVWCVGQVLHEYQGRASWAFCGAFSTEEAAEGACATRNHFLAPTVVDQPPPEAHTAWPGARYPVAEREDRT